MTIGKASNNEDRCGLFTRLEETMRTVKAQLAEMGAMQLHAPLSLLAPELSIGSAEMILTILALRERRSRQALL
ncbi:hypothetical protein [Mesorhizobium sp. J8]|uniref:hypothetical protein n=1 Tax=Mesorhizobium sp. J8 TaxID=2777475 RepID=UPI00191611B1|nr:hypothetical protein [Mesorhizobium sp. J8]